MGLVWQTELNIERTLPLYVVTLREKEIKIKAYCKVRGIVLVSI